MVQVGTKIRRAGMTGAAILAMVVLVTGCTSAGTWTDTAPEPGGFFYYAQQLADVDCAAPDLCVTVGPGTGAVWDGKEWVETPLPSNASAGFVACGAPAWCLANLSRTSDGQSVPLSRLVDGRWVPAEDPDATLTGTSVTDVACASESACMASIDRAGTSELVRWDGSSWTRTPTPSAPGGPLHLACPSADACVAVGSGTAPAAFTWNGELWSKAESPPVSSRAIACASETSCLVPGFDLTTMMPSVARWDGDGWTISNPAEPVQAVDCESPGWCLAVTAGDRPAAYVFTDDRWQPAPVPGASRPASLTALACTSPEQCVAVGMRTEGATPHRAALWWDGTGWADEPDLGRPTRARARFQAVSCPSDTWCAAAGIGMDGSRFVPMAQTWGGTSWTVAPLPAVDLDGDVDISCTSPTFCVVTGVTSPGRPGRNRILQWDGVTWKAVDLTPVIGTGRGPSRVSCADSTFCVATGGGATLRYDGSAWQAMAAPPGSVRDVDCWRPSRCRATALTGTTALESIVGSWDGLAWRTESLPLVDGISPVAEQLSCIDDQRCIAVGRGTRAFDPLVLTFDGTAWAAVPVAPHRDDTGAAVDCIDARRCLLATMSAGVDQSGAFVTNDVSNPSSWLPTAALPHGDGLTTVVASVACRPSWCMAAGYEVSAYDRAEQAYAARLHVTTPTTTATASTVALSTPTIG